MAQPRGSTLYRKNNTPKAVFKVMNMKVCPWLGNATPKLPTPASYLELSVVGSRVAAAGLKAPLGPQN